MPPQVPEKVKLVVIFFRHARICHQYKLPHVPQPPKNPRNLPWTGVIRLKTRVRRNPRTSPPLAQWRTSYPPLRIPALQPLPLPQLLLILCRRLSQACPRSTRSLWAANKMIPKRVRRMAELQAPETKWNQSYGEDESSKRSKTHKHGKPPKPQ